MELKNLRRGDVILRAKYAPMLFIRYQTDPEHRSLICVFIHLETGIELPYDEWILNALSVHYGWFVLERSSQAGHSDSVT